MEVTYFKYFKLEYVTYGYLIRFEMKTIKKNYILEVQAQKTMFIS